MASFINTNMVSLNTQNNLNKSQSALAQSIHRLSTGLRINSAKDDASGVAIANRLEASIRGQTVAVRNTNDAISFSQYAEGALNQVYDNLQRMRELAVQASNGVNGSSDRELLNTEFFQLQSEIDRIRNNTKFNGLDALGDKSFTIQTGAGTSSYDKITVQGIDLSKVEEIAKPAASKSKASTTFTQAQFDSIKADIAKQQPDRANKLFFNAANGHVYELVTTAKNYETAVTDAASKVFGSQKGYLATITSADENTFVYNKTGGNWTWINGNDDATEGTFVYSAGGPESGNLTYKNFAGGEPNNWGNEDGVHLWGGGTWNDLNTGAGIWSVVEYGGVGSSSSTGASTNTQLTTANAAGDSLFAFQVKSNTSYTTVTGDLDANGDALEAGLSLTSGQFVYRIGTGTDKDQAPTLTTGDNGKLAAVYSPSEDAAPADLTIYGNASGINILTQGDAATAITSIDDAMKQVNVAQIQQGATQNRLSAVISVLTSSTESLTRAKSNIMDTDYASETAVLARNQILQQAGIAMLAQANQLPNNIMTLLKG
jgi:flagellin